MANLKLTDILSASPGGKAQLHVDGYAAVFLLPTHVRDYHPMGRFQRWMVGQMTPGMTWRNGIAIAEELMHPAFMTPRQIVELILHETVHWWQLWRRMGPTDFPATYGWHGLIQALKGGSGHIHADHMVEREARRVAQNILFGVDLTLQARLSVTFDVEWYLQQHYPASRP